MTDHRAFITGVLQDMEGNAVMAVATGRTPRNKLEIREFKWFRYPEQLDQMVEYSTATRKGDKRNVYLSPLIYGDEVYFDQKSQEPVPLDRNGDPQYARSLKNALFSHTIYMDSDSCPPDAFRLPPSRHVQTSRTHGHDYWFLTEAIPAQQAAEIAHRITTFHRDQGTDPSGWSANKLLRMPTVNTSYDPQSPYQITFTDSGEVYDWADVSGAYDGVQVVAPGPAGSVIEIGDIPEIEGLPDFMDLVAQIPSTEHRINDLIYKVPKVGDKGWRSEQLFALCLDLIRYGFDDEEVASIAWHAPASSKWKEDQRGIQGLWTDVKKARGVVEMERREAGTDTEPEETIVHRPVVQASIKLLNDDERKRFERRYNFQTEYMEHARSRVPVFNRPYHSMNALVVMGAAFAEVGYLPKSNRKVPCNFYVFELGPSSSGKTEAIMLMLDVIRAINPHDDPEIPANSSETVLIEQLIERENKISLVWTDEADGLLALMRTGGWTTGIQSTWTKVYDGDVPKMGRAGRAELRKQNVKAIPFLHFMGTEEGMFGVMDRPMFKTGFLARPLWVMGDDIEPSRESMKTRQVVGNPTRHYESMPKYWSSQVAQNRARLMRTAQNGEKQVPILFTEEALEIYDRAKWDLTQHFMHSEDPEVFKTSIRRLNDSIWKISALMAMADGSRWITTDHVIHTLGLAEEWVTALIYIANGVAGSEFSKACDEIERFIAAQKDSTATASAIYTNRRAERVIQVDAYLESLMKQRRILERVTSNIKNAPRSYQINDRRKRTA